MKEPWVSISSSKKPLSCEPDSLSADLIIMYNSLIFLLNLIREAAEKFPNKIVKSKLEYYPSGKGYKQIFQVPEYATGYSRPAGGLWSLWRSCRAPWLRSGRRSHNISCLVASQVAALCLFKKLTWHVDDCLLEGNSEKHWERELREFEWCDLHRSWVLGAHPKHSYSWKSNML